MDLGTMFVGMPAVQCRTRRRSWEKLDRDLSERRQIAIVVVDLSCRLWFYSAKMSRVYDDEVRRCASHASVATATSRGAAWRTTRSSSRVRRMTAPQSSNQGSSERRRYVTDAHGWSRIMCHNFVKVSNNWRKLCIYHTLFSRKTPLITVLE